MLLEANFFSAHTIVCVADGFTPPLKHALGIVQELADVAHRVTLFAICKTSRNSFADPHSCTPTHSLSHSAAVAP